MNLSLLDPMSLFIRSASFYYFLTMSLLIIVINKKIRQNIIFLSCLLCKSGFEGCKVIQEIIINKNHMIFQCLTIFFMMMKNSFNLDFVIILLEMSSLKASTQTNIPNSISSMSSQDQPNDDQSLHFYFQSYPIKDMGNYMVTSFYSEKIIAGLDILIHLGAVQVNKKRRTVESLMDHVEISEQQRIAKEQRQRKQFLERQLHLLDHQTRPVQNESAAREEEQQGLILSKEQHKQIADRFKRQFMERSKRHQQLLQQMTKRIKQEEQLRNKQSEQKNTIELQQRRQHIQNKLKQNRKRKQELAKFEQLSNERIKQINQNKFKYSRLELKYQRQIMLPLIQQKQKKLREIKEQKSFNLADIKQHERDYLQKKSLHESRKTIFQQDWTYVPPPRSQRLTVIMEEQKLQKIMKIQQKKGQIQQNLAKHAEYAAYLRRNFVPRIDPAKREEIEQRLHRQRPVRPQSLDLKSIGMAYLEEAKRRKKRISKLQDPTTIQVEVNTSKQPITNTPHSQQKRTNSTIPVRAHKDNRYYSQKRKEKIIKVINDKEIDDPQRIHMLSLETDKLDASMKRKELQLKYKKDKKLKEEALQLLLSSISAKIGIIEAYS